MSYHRQEYILQLPVSVHAMGPCNRKIKVLIVYLCVFYHIGMDILPYMLKKCSSINHSKPRALVARKANGRHFKLMPDTKDSMPRCEVQHSGL